MAIVASLVIIDSTKTLDVVENDVVKPARGLLGVFDHLLEGSSANGAGAADGVIDVELAQAQAQQQLEGMADAYPKITGKPEEGSPAEAIGEAIGA